MSPRKVVEPPRNFVLEAEGLSPDKENRTLLRKRIIQELRITRQAYYDIIMRGGLLPPKHLDRFRQALQAEKEPFYALAIEHFCLIGEKRRVGRPRKQTQ